LAWNVRTEERVVAALRERCSFHLFVPMPEAYFLMDPGALRHLGGQRESCADPAADVEDPGFRIDDPDLEAGDVARRHAKHYVNFLCASPNEAPAKRAYKETKQGVAILNALDWNRVLGPTNRSRYLRSLVHDLAWAIGELTGDYPAPPFPGELAPLTARKERPRVLRNI
jgi:hypothetical protein